MKEYKIECKNPMEKSEVINLLVKIGYRDASTSDKYLTIVTFDDGGIFSITPNDDQYECNKCLSIEQLRSMAKPKEYLFKGIDGSYHIIDHDCQGRAIEIPEGAECLTERMDKEVVFRLFWKGNYKICIGFDEDWYDIGYDVNEYKNDPYYNSPSIVWQRHTQPEELPFVDDDPKISDLAINIGKTQFNRCESKSGNFLVDETLQERQSQYGEFKEVASTTQYLLQMLSNDKMSDVQLESLHMICSKLSRIAHGDPNHIDSWHDIAGYATLVVKDIS